MHETSIHTFSIDELRAHNVFPASIPDLESRLLWGPTTTFEESILFNNIQQVIDTLPTENPHRGSHVAKLRFGYSGNKNYVEAVLTKE